MPTPSGVQPGTFPVGRSVTFSFDVDVGVDAAGTDLTNSATITYDGATVPELQDLTFATRAASIPVIASADLAISKVNTPDPVVAGNALTSRITVRNDGPSPAAGVQVVDELPAGVTGVAALEPEGSCTPAVSCDVGTVAAGETVTVTVRATVPPGSTAASLTDVARVSADTADPDPDDNTAGATADVERNADLAVTKSVTPATAAPGEEVTYTLTATNKGPSTATSVVLTDTVDDPDLVLTGASAPRGDLHLRHHRRPLLRGLGGARLVGGDDGAGSVAAERDARRLAEQRGAGPVGHPRRRRVRQHRNRGRDRRAGERRPDRRQDRRCPGPAAGRNWRVRYTVVVKQHRAVRRRPGHPDRRAPGGLHSDLRDQ